MRFNEENYFYFRPVPMVLSLMVHSKKLKKNGFVFKADLDMSGGCVLEYGSL